MQSSSPSAAARSTKQRGVAAIEFALILPVFLLLVLGGIEVMRFVLINQKVDNAASSIANVVSSTKDPQNYNSWATLYSNMGALLYPYNNTAYKMIVTGIDVEQDAQGNNHTKIAWQNDAADQGSIPDATGPTVSKLGAVGDDVTAKILPIVMDIGQVNVAVEVFYEHKNVLNQINLPLFTNINSLDKNVLYNRSIYRLRYTPYGLREPPPATEPPSMCVFHASDPICGSYTPPAGEGSMPPPPSAPPAACDPTTHCCDIQTCEGG